MSNQYHEEDEEYLTKEELSDRLRVCVRTLVRWMKQGRIPFYRWGRKTVRFKWHKVQQALEKPQEGKVLAHGHGARGAKKEDGI